MIYEGKLRRVGGSVMLAIPPAALEAIGARAEDSVEMDVKSGRLTVVPARPRKYTLDQLIGQAKRGRKPGKDREWVAGRRAGRELI